MARREYRYFLWIALQLAVWFAAIGRYLPELGEHYWRLFYLSGSVACFFLMPLFAARPRHAALLVCVNSVLAAAALYPASGESVNLFLLLVYGLLTGEALYRRLPLAEWSAPALVQSAALVILTAAAEQTPRDSLFALMAMGLLIGAGVMFSLAKRREHDGSARYEALLAEYRELRRRSASDEDIARQEERKLIGHEIHDSVGHKLTALLMQLEVMRIQAASEQLERVEQLKRLAQDSLDETRRAVSSYRQEEPGGLQGIMRLIRNLEKESFLRVHFTVRHGAFSAPLDGEASFVIYRSVQEALTNMMKHASTRVANVMFEAPASRMFRFEISNPAARTAQFREGYGLTAMRERLQRFGGGMEAFHADEQFVVRGWIRLEVRGEADDQRIIGGGSGDGPSRVEGDD